MEDEKQPEATPPVADGLFEKLKNHLLANYLPGNNWDDKCVTKTTAEIFHSFQSLYPSVGYSMEDVARILHDAGFNFIDISNGMKFEWILHPS